MQVKSIVASLVAILMFAVVAIAAATTVVRLDFDALVEASDRIVVGHVATVTPFEQKGRIFTRIEVRVDETLKGEHEPKLQIVHIGGRTEKLVTRVAGMPDFTVGEHVLLFLEKPDSVDHFVVTGLAQGKIALDEQADGSPKLRHPDTTELHTVEPKLKRVDEATVVAPRKPLLTLDDAKARIAKLRR